MVEKQLTPVDHYVAAYESLDLNGASNGASWVRELRSAAISKFSEIGLPTTRRGNEEWKYTDVRPIARREFRPATASSASAVLADKRWEQFTFGETGWNLLVFVNGAYMDELSSLPSLPAGVKVTDIATAIESGDALAKEHLGRHADYENSGFTALNTAFIQNGAVIHIPDNAVLEVPIHLLFLFTSQEDEAVTHPRVLIQAGVNSSATVIETYAGLSQGLTLTNAVTEVLIGQGASLRHYTMQQQSEDAYHISTTEAVLSRDSSFSSVVIDLGGKLVRHNLNARMAGEGAICSLNGLYMVTGTQHVDNQVIIEHKMPYTTSRELYKGILDGKSRSVFHGSIIVREGAKKVDAFQTDKNLLLSDQAEADTKPAFWIYTDDVRCGHGASCGHIDENAVFYMKSRGLDDLTARNFLIHGFVSEVIAKIELEPLREHVDQIVHTKLRGWLDNGESQ